jgi:DNA-binding NtrC family response regulator
MTRDARNIDSRLTEIIGELLEAGIPLEMANEQFEQKYIATALLRCRRNKTRAALLLGVHRNTLHNKLRLTMLVEKRYRR